jgi:predicted nucleic-acid-binding protein
MSKVVVQLPKELEKERAEIERKLCKFVALEAKRKRIIELFDKIMENAKQLSDKEIIEFSKKFKKAGAEELREKGLI